MIKYISTLEGLTYYVSGQVRRVAASSPKYFALLTALTSNSAESTILEIEKEAAFSSDFSEIDGELYYKDDILSAALAQKARSLLSNGLDMNIFAALYERLTQNTSYCVREQILSFMEYKELPITPDGKIIAWKGVRDDYYSVTGNKKTRIYDGEVDIYGHILNSVGSYVVCDRADVCDDPNIGCAPGLHAGSLDYARGWGARVMVVLIDPKDIVSVPKDCSCQKMRVCAYEVIGEYCEDKNVPVLTTTAEPVESEGKINLDKIKARIKNYLDNKKTAGYTSSDCRAIQSSFSPDCPPIAQIRTLVAQLGYTLDSAGRITL